MRLVSKVDVEAPASFVFAQLADFDAWERGALRRGADVIRTDNVRRTGPGMTWMIRFAFRARERQLQVRLTKFDPALGMVFAADGPSVLGGMELDLVDLTPRRTRIILRLEIKPKNLPARLFVQSLKLMRGRLVAKLDARVKATAKEIEDRYLAT